LEGGNISHRGMKLAGHSSRVSCRHPWRMSEFFSLCGLAG
jgi:hypothetical protein